MEKRESWPTAADVAGRLVVLKYVVLSAMAGPPRELLQQTMAAWSQEDREQFRRDAEVKREEFWGT